MQPGRADVRYDTLVNATLQLFHKVLNLV
eukprot:SAG31_NODE_10593_length_1120_cov_1.161606_1_plen_28_part_10